MFDENVIEKLYINYTIDFYFLFSSLKNLSTG